MVNNNLPFCYTFQDYDLISVIEDILIIETWVLAENSESWRSLLDSIFKKILSTRGAGIHSFRFKHALFNPSLS